MLVGGRCRRRRSGGELQLLVEHGLELLVVVLFFGRGGRRRSRGGACVPAAEICNGKDDDCNGKIDDGPGVDAACAAKNPGFVCKTGACACALMCAGACINPGIDPMNCGACGHDCLGAACKAGQCEATRLATGAYPAGLAVDATSAYFTNSQSEPGVVKVPTTGGATVALASMQQTPRGSRSTR